MKICVSLKTINLAGTGFLYDADDNLYDLIVQYDEDRIPIKGPTNFYYAFSDNRIFALMDTIEQCLPIYGHEICWNWTGVRKGTDYYLLLEVQALSEATARFWNTLGSIFPDLKELDTPFELPEIDCPINLDDPDTFDSDIDYEECDEMSILRDFEKLTYNNPDGQWKREPKEYGGAVGSVVLLGTAAAIAAFGYPFLKDFVSFCMRNHYKNIIETLEQKVIEASKGQGRIIPPEPKAPEVYNMEREENEYEFTQIMNDGTRNRVFIGVNSGKVSFMPYK